MVVMVIMMISILLISPMEVVGQFNPYKCEGFPRDVTPFHYSGIDHHVYKQAVSFASFPTVRPSVCLSVCLSVLLMLEYVYILIIQHSIFNDRYCTGRLDGLGAMDYSFIVLSIFGAHS